MELAKYQIEAIKKGYLWECSCGEIYKTETSARICRKCPVPRDPPIYIAAYLPK